jgi:hypothetical protein
MNMMMMIPIPIKGTVVVNPPLLLLPLLPSLSLIL